MVAEKKMAALHRFNTFTYHLRPSYVFDRMARLAVHWSEHVLSGYRVDRIVGRCQQHARRAAESDPGQDQQRRAA